jgi:hypothetical protein
MLRSAGVPLMVSDGDVDVLSQANGSRGEWSAWSMGDGILVDGSEDATAVVCGERDAALLSAVCLSAVESCRSTLRVGYA